MSYNESVAGDLNGQPFTLDVGTNTFTGTTESGVNNDVDSFRFAGTITSISVSYNSISFTNILDYEPGSFLLNGGFFVANDGLPELISGGAAVPMPFLTQYDPALFPLSGTDFTIFMGAGSWTPTAPDGDVLLNYTITIDMSEALTPLSNSPVPLPTSLPLFATGLGGLGLLGWRTKRKAQAVA